MTAVKIKRKEDFSNPKFYIKEAGDSFSIYHRMTHSFMSSVGSYAELVEEISHLNKLSDKLLYEYLIYTQRCHLPNATFWEKRFAEEEETLRSAWGKGTEKFYSKHPECFVAEEKIPYEVVAEIRTEKLQSDIKRDKMVAKMREEKAKKEAEVLAEEKKVKIVVKPTKNKRVKIIRKKKGNSVIGIPKVQHTSNPFD